MSRSYGEASAQALKDFLAYTQDHWNRRPRSVLLGGDGSLDPRGFMGPAGAAADIIPVKLLDTQFMERLDDAPVPGRHRTVALIAAALAAYERAGRETPPAAAPTVSPWARLGRPGSSGSRPR